jgi:hypothetical protein
VPSITRTCEIDRIRGAKCEENGIAVNSHLGLAEGPHLGPLRVAGARARITEANKVVIFLPER